MIHRDSKAQTYWRMAAWLLVVLSLWVGIPVMAQSGRGTLTGIVKDSDWLCSFRSIPQSKRGQYRQRVRRHFELRGAVYVS